MEPHEDLARLLDLDDAAIRANYADALRKHGHDVQAYGTRAEAMTAFRARLPDLARYGDVSYGLYLWAFPVQQLAVHLLGAQGGWRRI